MKRHFLLMTLFLNCIVSFSNTDVSEPILERYLDSIFEINNVDYVTLESELLNYTKINYKKLNSIEDLIDYGSTKLSQKTKNFSKQYLSDFQNLKLLSYYTNSTIKEFEELNSEIIEMNNLWEEAKLPSRLYIFLHEINYWGLNVYKPSSLASKLQELYLSTSNKSLANKIAIFILTEKIYNSNHYVNRIHVCESAHHNIKISTAQKKIILPSTEDAKAFASTIDPPKFPGGEDLMIRFIVNNFEYPRKAIEQEIQGLIKTSFILDQNGIIKNIKIIESNNLILSKEAYRIFQSMPKWRPAFQEGKAIPVKFIFEVKFDLNKKIIALVSRLSEYQIINSNF